METLEKQLAEAYLLGAYLGDGHCSWNDGGDRKHNSYQLHLPSMDADLLDKVRASIYLCFPQLEGKVVISKYDKRNHELLWCSSIELCQFLRSRCDVKKRLPRFSDKLLFREFIAGLMDTDGWITENFARRQKPYVWEGKVWQMGFATTAPWYGLLNRLLQQSGVVLGKTTKVWQPEDKKDVWADCFRTYFNIASFVDAGFYFTIARKKNRIQNWQQHMRGESSETRSPDPTHA